VSVSPADFNAEETVMSLHYANRAKLITNKSVKNSETSEVMKMKSLIRNLQEEIGQLHSEKQQQEDEQQQQPEESENVTAVSPAKKKKVSSRESDEGLKKPLFDDQNAVIQQQQQEIPS
jgi:hypothetical protein